MIPQVIHRIWLDDPMPDVFDGHGRRWQQLHPGWDLIDWTSSAELPDLVNRDLFDTAETILPGDWVRLRADIVRLELLHTFGGVYADCDIEPHRPIGPLLDGRDVVVGRSPQHTRGIHPITNAFMAAVPGNRWIGTLVDQLPAAVAAHAGRSLAVMAGPWHLTRIYDAGVWPDVTVIDGLYDAGWFTHQWNTAARKAGRGVW